MMNIKSSFQVKHYGKGTFFFLPISLLILTIISSLILSSNVSKAIEDTVQFEVDTACTLYGGSTGTSTTGGTYSISLDPGTNQELTGSKLVTLCNDADGYSIYAIGYSGNSYDAPNNTKLLGTGTITGNNISTGTSGDNSYWAMKLSAASGVTPPTITNSFDSYHNVPETYTQIAEYASNTATSTSAGAAIQTNYKISVSSAQVAGTYTGKVKYTMVHPNDAPAPEPPRPLLYDLVAAMSKGTQTVEQLRTAIDAPDETETVSTNSGVYEYNASVFGTASDDNSACTRAGGCPIYYYRGILDSYGHTGTYGSNGDNDAFPNTVVLSSASSKSGLTTDDTCWRIVRTTGSGGVKMIYQGKWTANGDTGNCKNAQTNAQVTTSAFSGTSSTNRQIVRVGYTYNSTFAKNTSKSDTIANIFGSNSSPEKNNVRSDIKKYIEDDWYSGAIGASGGHDYTSKLEASAGYCNDRTMNTTNSWTTPLAESTTIASTYGTSGQQAYYFGAYPRNANAAQSPSLTCGNKYSQIDRSTVDLYRYVSSSTTDYTSNELKYPAALLTADEAAFAGSGYSSSTTPYHANSYLRSGSSFWLLSPYYRNSDGDAYGFPLFSNGSLDGDYVDNTRGVRPAISLTSGTTPASGTGTATDPWIVNP